MVHPIINEDEPPPCHNDMVDVPGADFLYSDGCISFEDSSLPTIAEETEPNIQNEIPCDECKDHSDLVPAEATTHPDPVEHADSSDVNELESMEAAYIDERSPEYDDIVSQLKQDVESGLLADLMLEPVPATTSPDGHSDVNDFLPSLPSVTQDSEDEHDHFNQLHHKDHGPCDMKAITNHRKTCSDLQLKIEWCSGYKSWAKFSDVKSNDPALIAKYVLAKYLKDHVHWARSTLRSLKCAVHHIRHAMMLPLTASDAISLE